MSGGSKEPQLHRPVSFLGTWSKLSEAGNRRLVTLWLLTSLLVVPSGVLTRLLELTGIPIVVGGVQVHITIYLPLIVCVPVVIWLGYLWASIPAYLSTFCVALFGGMPVGWALLFSFANPVGLAVPALAYRALPIRIDLRSIPSAMFFILVMFVSSLAGSLGSFVWAHTNRVGIHNVYPVWQGWWLGGFLQAVLVCAPIMMLISPAVSSWKERWRLAVVVREEAPSRRSLMAGNLTILLGIAGYVLLVRYFGMLELDKVLAQVGDLEVRQQILNAVDGFSLPQWVLLVFAGFTLFFGYRAGVTWTSALRRWSQHLTELNKELATKAQDLDIKNQELHRLSARDYLTDVYNRSYLMEALDREVSKSLRHRSDLSVIMIDIDRFKRINDTYGHLAGDQVLTAVARRIGDQLRQEDVLARYGGEEFVIMLPDTSIAGVQIVAEKIRQGLNSDPVIYESHSIMVSASFGLATLESGQPQLSVNQFLKQADDALLRAKREGRNRVVMATSC